MVWKPLDDENKRFICDARGTRNTSASARRGSAGDRE
jgi:hypothetical protein